MAPDQHYFIHQLQTNEIKRLIKTFRCTAATQKKSQFSTISTKQLSSAVVCLDKNLSCYFLIKQLIYVGWTVWILFLLQFLPIIIIVVIIKIY